MTNKEIFKLLDDFKLLDYDGTLLDYYDDVMHDDEKMETFLDNLINGEQESFKDFFEYLLNENSKPIFRGPAFYTVTEKRPTRATSGSAGYDFYAPKDIVIPAHGVSELFDTGVSVSLKEGQVLMLYIRSSLGLKEGITLANNVGIIDSDFFPNSISCVLRNDSDKDYILKKGDRFMQGIFTEYLTIHDRPKTKRKGGIGSTNE